MVASYAGHIDCVRELVLQGADINLQREVSQTVHVDKSDRVRRPLVFMAVKCLRGQSYHRFAPTPKPAADLTVPKISARNEPSSTVIICATVTG